MDFSDTTNKDGILQLCEDYASLGDGVITGDSLLLAKFTSYVNETVLDLTTDLMILNDDFDWDDPTKTDYPVATTPLVASQRDYQFDNLSFLKLNRVDVTYDGTTYYRATPFNSSSYQKSLGNDSTVDDRFSKTAPYYDPKGFGFWLYPMANATDVAAGALARIEFTRAATAYTTTDTTKQPPIDRPFHDLIPMGAALKWPNLSDKQYQKLLGRYEAGRERMRQHYSKRNEDAFLTLATDKFSNHT